MSECECVCECVRVCVCVCVCAFVVLDYLGSKLVCVLGIWFEPIGVVGSNERSLCRDERCVPCNCAIVEGRCGARQTFVLV